MELQFKFVRFQKDAYIVVEGNRNADCFFIIREGKVRISKIVKVVKDDGGDILGPGDFFAVVSAMSAHSHIETAQALTDCTLISVPKDRYGDLIQNNTAVAMKIILQFSRRMRYLDAALTKLALKDNSAENVSQLFNVGEYYSKIYQYDLAHYAYSRYIKHCPQGEHRNAARQRMMKLASRVSAAPREYLPDEFTRKFSSGTMVFAEGEPGDELYIIQKGAVKIVKIADNNEILLAVLRPGDIFGEMALLESKPRTACAVAYEDCVLLMVSKSNFAQTVTAQPQIIAKLTVLLAERIWFIYKQITNTLIDNPLGRIYDALVIQLEKNRVNTKIEQAYTFNFGLNELVNMVGLPPADGDLMIRKIIVNRKIQLVDGKIYVLDVRDIVQQAQAYRRTIRKTKSLGA
jgi:CRP-like cAMP-binding protein